MLSELNEQVKNSPALSALADAVRANQTVALYDLCEGQRAFAASFLHHVTGRCVLLVTRNESTALRLADDCSRLSGKPCRTLPAEDITFTPGSSSRETLNMRLETLLRASRGELAAVVCTVDALMTRFPIRSELEKRVLRVMTEQEAEPAELIRRLVSAGYERVPMVEGKGQCALRGEILDVFPPDREMACRIEFFDTQVDSIREFDCVSQRSADRLTQVLISPAVSDFIPAGTERETAEAIRRMVSDQVRRLPQDLMLGGMAIDPTGQEGGTRISSRVGLGLLLDSADTLEETGFLPGAENWSGVAFPAAGGIRSWLNDPIVILDAPDQLSARADDRLLGFQEDLKNALERQEAVPEQVRLMLSFQDLLPEWSGLPLILAEDFLRDSDLFHPDTSIQWTGHALASYLTRFKGLADDIRTYQNQQDRVILLAGGVARAERLQAALDEQGVHAAIREEKDLLSEPGPVILPVSLNRGMILPGEKLCIIADSDIFGAGYRKPRRSVRAGEKLEAFTDLHEGDYVVHEHHGIGIFRGITRVQTEGTARDYLLITYLGGDKLYVPIDQFERVQKYIGSTEDLPPLSSLGGGEWTRQKKKVKAGLKKLAFDLVRLYADRKAIPGHAFGPDTPWQRQMEDAFPYELTPDQQRAVRDITEDMEKPVNMDRLLCGDVGYGKTEVAVRAAFKAVMDGKQVAFLAPTTILVQQHYLNLLERLKDFPVSIDMISRFRTPKEQKETIQRVAEGKVDILVGTHRMLSKQVQFKDLGLLIVDEEQRFGVGHKEAIKNIKKTVDVLTMSATPIPRTLHMSMVGVRDISLLETPPEERYPIRTYVIEYNDAVIRDAIRRELSRKGQVYFLYNRVQSIEEFRQRLQRMLPEARIAIAHGQMKENALEDVMLDFFSGRYDVLLSTTIIENGLDVQNANTMIVYDADRFGLSQLYQLRGRVGRSNRAAYAYFTVRPDRMISEDAQKRLSAIREFTQFGSGFRIAMRDLEIRGAGNIFGPEQSGNVSNVGYEMYVRLIEEAVQEAQSEMEGRPAETPRADTRVDLKVNAYLPDSYVSGEVQRMEIYKRISLIRSRVDREDVIEELIDRFGEPPEEVMMLIDIAHLRSLCSSLGALRVSWQAQSLVIRLDPALMPPVDRLYTAMQQTDERLLLSASKDPALLFRDKRYDVRGLLEKSVPVIERLTEQLSQMNGTSKEETP